MPQLAMEAALRRTATLPPDQAEVVLLAAVGGLPVAEIAKIMETQPGAVRALQQSALRRLALEATEQTEEAVTR